MITLGKHPFRLVAVLLAILGGLPPVIIYWALVARVPAVTPEKAKEILAEPGAAAVLVDVRTPEEFAAGHIEAARNWPHAEIMALTSAKDVPAELNGKRLLLICQSGILSSLATQRLRALGVFDAVNVQGGVQTWVASGEKPCTLGLCRLRSAAGEVRDLPLRESPPLEQWVAVLTGFVVKPIYTLAALVLIVVLWRQRSPELAALCWALLCFFVGENFCAANYIACADRSVAFEYLHSYGMVLCFGLTTYAVLEGIDRRLIRLSDPAARCAALGLCRRCIKHEDVPCGLQRVFLLLIPAAIIVALAPLCAELIPVSYNTAILGAFYNYSHPVVYQVFEVRFLPAVAASLLAVSFAVLRFKKRDAVPWSKVFFSAGMGAMGFSFFRLLFFQAYRDNLVWFGAWEEITELLFVLGVGLVLWVFREALLPELAAVLAGKGLAGKPAAR
jgi:rhodanese-related sulfurtransferase